MEDRELLDEAIAASHLMEEMLSTEKMARVPVSHTNSSQDTSITSITSNTDSNTMCSADGNAAWINGQVSLTGFDENFCTLIQDAWEKEGKELRSTRGEGKFPYAADRIFRTSRRNSTYGYRLVELGLTWEKYSSDVQPGERFVVITGVLRQDDGLTIITCEDDADAPCLLT